MQHENEDTVISIGLTLPLHATRVVLLCTDTKLNSIHIDGKEVTELNVSKVLFESSVPNKKVLIFQCMLRDDHETTMCLKLMDNNDIYQSEKLAYERMVENNVTDIFLKVHFFCEVILPDKRVWKGYCMQEGKYSIRDILYPVSSDSISIALDQKKLLQMIRNDKERMQKKMYADENFERGMKVLFKPDQTIQMSIGIAALRLLHRMHTEYGWVHGDSHLGNFMYLDGKIYAIDFERSFATNNKVQHLLDIQEFFGHFSGILLNQLKSHAWDMRDIFGIYYYRHPLISRGGQHNHNDDSWFLKSSNFSRRKTLYMLPICFCFTCNNEELRLKGCDFCKSHTNVKSAAYVSDNFDEIIKDLNDWGLMKMKKGLNHTRTNSILKQCCNIADIIYPCIQDGRVLTYNRRDGPENKRQRVGKPSERQARF